MTFGARGFDACDPKLFVADFAQLQRPCLSARCPSAGQNRSVCIQRAAIAPHHGSHSHAHFAIAHRDVVDRHAVRGLVDTEQGRFPSGLCFARDQDHDASISSADRALPIARKIACMNRGTASQECQKRLQARRP